MRIVFKRIEIQNFKSFDNEVFEFDALEGLNLICGKNNDLPGSKNGCGKSALFSALVFSLFGQTQENIKNENIHNKYINSKEIRVVTYFDIEDHHYKVVSGHNDKGRPYCNVYEQVDNDEIDLTKSTMSETRKFLTDEVLHCDLSIFLRTVFLSSDQNYNFFRLHKWEKKEFIEKLFDISVFGKMYDVIHRDTLDIDKQIVQHQDKIMLLNKNSDTYKAKMEKHDADAAEKSKSLHAKLEQLQQMKTDYQSKKVDVHEAETHKCELLLEKIDSVVRKINSADVQLSNEANSLTLSMHKLNTSKDSKQKALDKHAALISKLCDKCKSVFKDYYNISTYSDEIAEMDKKLVELGAQKAEVAKKRQALSDKANECNTKTEKVKQKMQSLTREHDLVQKKIMQIEAQVSSVENEILNVEKAKNPYTELFESNQVDLDSEMLELKSKSEKYKYLHFAESIVSQDTLRKFIISDLIGLLNNKIKTYLTKLGARYDVVFDSDMNYTFMTEGGTCEYDNFSSGERARLMIAACFAFRDFMHIRNNFSSNILILDEFIDGAIDSAAIESILEILKDFSQIWNQNIFVISHRKEVNNDVFDNIIQVVKENNISKVTYLDA